MLPAIKNHGTLAAEITVLAPAIRAVLAQAAGLAELYAGAIRAYPAVGAIAVHDTLHAMLAAIIKIGTVTAEITIGAPAIRAVLANCTGFADLIEITAFLTFVALRTYIAAVLAMNAAVVHFSTIITAAAGITEFICAILAQTAIYTVKLAGIFNTADTSAAAGAKTCTQAAVVAAIQNLGAVTAQVADRAPAIGTFVANTAVFAGFAIKTSGNRAFAARGTPGTAFLAVLAAVKNVGTVAAQVAVFAEAVRAIAASVTVLTKIFGIASRGDAGVTVGTSLAAAQTMLATVEDFRAIAAQVAVLAPAVCAVLAGAAVCADFYIFTLDAGAAGRTFEGAFHAVTAAVEDLGTVAAELAVRAPAIHAVIADAAAVTDISVIALGKDTTSTVWTPFAAILAVVAALQDHGAIAAQVAALAPAIGAVLTDAAIGTKLNICTNAANAAFRAVIAYALYAVIAAFQKFSTIAAQAAILAPAVRAVFTKAAACADVYIFTVLADAAARAAGAAVRAMLAAIENLGTVAAESADRTPTIGAVFTDAAVFTIVSAIAASVYTASTIRTPFAALFAVAAAFQNLGAAAAQAAVLAPAVRAIFTNTALGAQLHIFTNGANAAGKTVIVYTLLAVLAAV